MDVLVDFGQFPFGTPAKLCLFLLFQSLEFPNQINFEFGTEPHGKLKCNILMGVSTAIASCLGCDSDTFVFCIHSFALKR